MYDDYVIYIYINEIMYVCILYLMGVREEKEKSQNNNNNNKNDDYDVGVVVVVNDIITANFFFSSLR